MTVFGNESLQMILDEIDHIVIGWVLSPMTFVLIRGERLKYTGRKAMSCGTERSKLCSCTQGRPRAAASEKLREKRGTDSPSEPPGGTHPASTLPPEL